MNQDLELRERELRSFFVENKDRRVGIPGDENWCPIATYFCEKKNLNVSVGIGGEIFEVEDRQNRRLMKKWEQNFADQIDNRYEHCDKVTGSQALVVLEDVTRGNIRQLQLF